MKKNLWIGFFIAMAVVCGAAEVRFAPKAVSPRRAVFNKAEKLTLKPGSFEIVVAPKSTPTARYAGKMLSETL